MKYFFLFLVAVLLITGCSNQSKGEPYTLSIKDNENINSYLEVNLIKPIKEGEINSVFEVLGSNKNRDEVYVWALLEEVYVEGGAVKHTSGLSLPLVLEVEEWNGEIMVKKHKAPRDGEKFNSDINKLFPKNVRETISTFDRGYLEKQLEDKD